MNKTQAVWFVVIVILVGVCPAGAGAITAPVEPQSENPEFTLDVWTSRYDRYWREVWDGGDNRYRLRFGSNNVREWYLEEELKLPADLLPNRLRFRFYHSRLYHDSSDRRNRDTFELELRLMGHQYVSLFVSPTFVKAENSLGVMFQRRTQVDRYFKFIAELPHAVRNFAERHGERPGAQYQVFTDAPIRLVVDARGPVSERFWGRFVIDLVPSFETAMEDHNTGIRWRHERGSASIVGGWMEYAAGDRALEQAAGGMNYLFASRSKNGDLPRTFEVTTAEVGWSRSDDPAPALIPVGVGDEYYKLTEPDSVLTWSDNHAAVEPFVRLPLGGRWILKSSVRFDYREIDYTFVTGETREIKNRSIVAGAGGQVKLGRSLRSLLEAGFAVEYRNRRERCCPGTAAWSEDIYRDSRVYVSYEYRFSPTRMIRLIETIDLDREDWGSFSIHDHGFVQAVFSF